MEIIKARERLFPIQLGTNGQEDLKRKIENLTWSELLQESRTGKIDSKAQSQKDMVCMTYQEMSVFLKDTNPGDRYCCILVWEKFLDEKYQNTTKVGK